jgi:hypothetical protein
MGRLHQSAYCAEPEPEPPATKLVSVRMIAIHNRAKKKLQCIEHEEKKTGRKRNFCCILYQTFSITPAGKVVFIFTYVCFCHSSCVCVCSCGMPRFFWWNFSSFIFYIRIISNGRTPVLTSTLVHHSIIVCRVPIVGRKKGWNRLCSAEYHVRRYIDSANIK